MSWEAFMKLAVWQGLVVGILGSSLALAQSSGVIEKIKITDGDLTCKQIYAEIGEMDKLMGVNKQTRDNASTANTAADVAQTALPAAAQAAAYAGNYAGAVGLAQALPFASIFGSVAKGVAKQQESSAAETLGNAKGRKEHLTGLFLQKGCKLSDVAPPAPAPATAAMPAVAPVVAADATPAAATATAAEAPKPQ
jgi:hypothetical protein